MSTGTENMKVAMHEFDSRYEADIAGKRYDFKNSGGIVWIFTIHQLLCIIELLNMPVETDSRKIDWTLFAWTSLRNDMKKYENSTHSFVIFESAFRNHSIFESAFRDHSLWTT